MIAMFFEKIKRVHRNIPVGVQKDSETQFVALHANLALKLQKSANRT